jgi:shikimate kinase
MSPRVVLIGLPGAGKSSVGAALAGLLSLDFTDSDDLIIDMTGRPIVQIFADDGELAFRDIEAVAVAGALRNFAGVLALGGGAITTASVRAALVEAGVPVVLLTASQDQLLARIGHTRHRPLLVGDASDRLATLAAERESLYREVATIVIDTGSHTVGGVAAEIHRQLAHDHPAGERT